jgi:peptidoglycan/LPS O-acetylase OafA/YrhL
MLPGSILILAIGTIYAVVVATAKQRPVVAAVIVGLSAAGFGAGFALTRAGTPEHTYYPIAAAIFGALIGFAWVARKRKSWQRAGK